MKQKMISQAFLAIVLVFNGHSGVLRANDECAITNGAFVDYMKDYQTHWDHFRPSEALLRALGIEFPIVRSPFFHGFRTVSIPAEKAKWIDPLGFGKEFEVVLYKQPNIPALPILIRFKQDGRKVLKYLEWVNQNDFKNEKNELDKTSLEFASNDVPVYINLLSNVTLTTESKISKFMKNLLEDYLDKHSDIHAYRIEDLVYNSVTIPELINRIPMIESEEGKYVHVRLPGVFSFNGDALAHLIQQTIRLMHADSKVLDFGIGSGFYANAIQHHLHVNLNSRQNQVHGIDINPVAVANAQLGAHIINDIAIGRQTRAFSPAPLFWESDLFANVTQKYDIIAYHALDPIKTNMVNAPFEDSSRWDHGGVLLNRFFQTAPDHLTDDGYMLVVLRQESEHFIPSHFERKLLVGYTDNQVESGVFQIMMPKNASPDTSRTIFYVSPSGAVSNNLSDSASSKQDITRTAPSVDIELSTPSNKSSKRKKNRKQFGKNKKKKRK